MVWSKLELEIPGDAQDTNDSYDKNLKEFENARSENSKQANADTPDFLAIQYPSKLSGDNEDHHIS